MRAVWALPLGGSFVVHFEGERDAERQVRVERADGVEHFEGERGAERLVRIERADGVVEHYVGEADAERKVRVVHADRVEQFGGGRGREFMTRIDYVCGRRQHLIGPAGHERDLLDPDAAVPGVYAGAPKRKRKRKLPRQVTWAPEVAVVASVATAAASV